MRRPPKFVVFDLTQLSNLDASASRGCFLQVVKMCTKRGITVCAAGASPRIDWMLRSHEVAYETAEEERIQALFQSRPDPASPPRSERILLFLTVHEALEFCENSLIHQMSPNHTGPFGGFYMLDKEEETHSLASVFKRILGCTGESERILHLLDGRRFHDRIELRVGQEGVDSFRFLLHCLEGGSSCYDVNIKTGLVYKHRQVDPGKVPKVIIFNPIFAERRRSGRRPSGCGKLVACRVGFWSCGFSFGEASQLSYRCDARRDGCGQDKYLSATSSSE
jgi:hypothetical protein